MIIVEVVLVILGAFITFFSGKISKAILTNKREPNEGDSVYIKLAGFALVLIATIMVFS